MLLPARCPVCDAPGAAPCAACRALLLPAPVLPPPPGVESCLALLAYEGAGRELVARLKYRNNRSALRGLAAAAASLVPDPGAFDAVTWVPTTPARRRQRGFDQAELLARAVARRLRRPCRRLLARGPGPAQTGRGAAERWSDVAIAARGPSPDRVLLVDDVVTSGATCATATLALHRAGASSVVVLALARTPLKATT